jgi:hypothetical protein
MAELERSREESRRLRSQLDKANLEVAQKRLEQERSIKGMEKVMESEREELLKELEELRTANQALLEEAVNRYATSEAPPAGRPEGWSEGHGKDEAARLMGELASQRKISEDLSRDLRNAHEMIKVGAIWARLHSSHLNPPNQ